MYAILYRSLFALLTAFGLAALLGPATIPMLHALHFGQNVRKEGPKSHKMKQGTPTMGGIMILAAIVVSTLLWGRDSYSFVMIALLMSGLYGLIGFADDFIKVTRKQSLGLRPWQKIAAQFVLGIGFAIWLYRTENVGPTLWLNRLDIGIFYVPFALFVIIACVNSVNLTDGLDGLAASVSAVYAVFLSALLCMAVVTATASADAKLLHDQSALSVFAMATAGASIGFLLYNAYPARVFMGDTGAFTLGGAVAAMALLSRTALLLPLMGICFVASAVSVILQVGSVKLRGKRIFRMAPLHHHFELGGVPEPKIVSAYSIVTAMSSAGALLLYWFMK